MPQILSDLAGTLRSAFRVARATFDAAGLTAARTVTLPDKSGTLAMLDDLGAGGDVDWTIVTAGQTLAAASPLVAAITTTQNFPLPATIAPGNRFTVRNSVDSTAGALVRVVAGAGRQIGTLAVADDLTCAPGETIDLVARTSTELDLLTPGAVGPPGADGPAGTSDHGALTGLADDDHTQYYNQARGDARYAQIGHGHAIADVTGLQTALDGKEASGAASSAVAAHVAAGDPHPQYLTPAEADAAYVRGTVRITVGTTAPSSPAVGDIWIDTN